MFGRLGVALVSRSTIPAKVEEQYQGKNIEFVSISVDKDREKWSNLVNKNNWENSIIGR
jgi:hypothetical protein